MAGGGPKRWRAVGKTRTVAEDEGLDRRMTDAWLTASEDLSLDVVAPLVLPMNGHHLRCTALVRRFGGPRGMLVMRGGVAEWQEARESLDQAVHLGFGFTHLGELYAEYDRSTFIRVLNDWGWRGDPEPAPGWYMREPWTTE